MRASITRIGHVVFARVPLPWPRPHRCTNAGLPGTIAGLDSLWIDQQMHESARAPQAAPAGVMLTSRAIAHMKAASSRAMAVATTVDFLPLRDSVRNRLQSRT